MESDTAKRCHQVLAGSRMGTEILWIFYCTHFHFLHTQSNVYQSIKLFFSSKIDLGTPGTSLFSIFRYFCGGHGGCSFQALLLVSCSGGGSFQALLLVSRGGGGSSHT